MLVSTRHIDGENAKPRTGTYKFSKIFLLAYVAYFFILQLLKNFF